MTDKHSSPNREYPCGYRGSVNRRDVWLNMDEPREITPVEEYSK